MTLALLLAALVAFVGIGGFALGPLDDVDARSTGDVVFDVLVDVSCWLFDSWDTAVRAVSALRKAVRA